MHADISHSNEEGNSADIVSLTVSPAKCAYVCITSSLPCNTVPDLNGLCG